MRRTSLVARLVFATGRLSQRPLYVLGHSSVGLAGSIRHDCSVLQLLRGPVRWPLRAERPTPEGVWGASWNDLSLAEGDGMASLVKSPLVYAVWNTTDSL